MKITAYGNGSGEAVAALEKRFGVTLPDEAEEQFLYSEKEMNIVGKHIEKRFGRYRNVLHELVSPDIHCDIVVIEPRRRHPYYTLVTMGAGAYPMNVPDAVEGSEWLHRAEFIINLPPYWKLGEADWQDEYWYWPIRALKAMARYSIENDTWLGHGHSMSGGEEVETFAPKVPFSAWMLTWAFGFGTKAAWCKLRKGEQVNFYQLHPLYAAELDYKRENGTDALIDRFVEWEGGGDWLHSVCVTRPDVCRGWKTRSGK